MDARNYKLKIQYDGAYYAGWQRQLNASTVQQTIEEALEILTKEKITLTGSGRTDTGVHALGQVANFKCVKKLDEEKVKYSLNSVLPVSIAVTDFREVDESFHSRFDAKKRSYIYLITSAKSPFYNNYSYFLRRSEDINIEEINSLSKNLLGKKDFTSFARKGSGVKNHICEINNIHWKRSGEKLIFYIEANRFLHGMVRTIIGTVLEIYKNGLSGKTLLEILEKKDRESAGEAVPSKGLFLYKVKY